MQQLERNTLHGTNISHLGKRNIIFKSALVGNRIMLLQKKGTQQNYQTSPQTSFITPSQTKYAKKPTSKISALPKTWIPVDVSSPAISPYPNQWLHMRLVHFACHPHESHFHTRLHLGIGHSFHLAKAWGGNDKSWIKICLWFLGQTKITNISTTGITRTVELLWETVWDFPWCFVVCWTGIVGLNASPSHDEKNTP